MSLTLFLSLALLGQADTPSPVEAIETAVADAIAKAERSVVAIWRIRMSETASDRTTAIRGEPDQPPLLDAFDPARLGGGEEVSFDYASGVVIGPEQAILTTFHAIRGANRIRVRAPGKVAFEAEIIAADPRSDLAVIAPRRIPNVAPPILVPIALGDASKLRKGAFLIALGNPYNAANDGTASAAWGILSNNRRKIDPPIGESKRDRLLQYFPTLLQLDSKLNVGMSGGAVVNLKGELVGITTSSANVVGFDVQAGYAIPMDPLTRRVVNSLREGREAEFGFLGISLDKEGRNVVGEAHLGSPAGEGGVLKDDVILMVGDQPVVDSETLVLAVNTLPVGRPVPIKLRRGERIIEKTIVLAKYPETGGISTNRSIPWRGLRVDYSSVLTGGMNGRPEFMAKGGVAVIDVVPGSPADLANMKRGLFIRMVGETSTKTPDQFAKAVENLTGPATLVTDQGEITIEAPVPIPPRRP